MIGLAKKSACVIAGLLFLFNITCKAQLVSYNDFFRTLNQRDGLEFTQINAIREDQDGFMWIGTDEGLQRYDGHRFLSFTHNPDKPEQSLVKGRIKALEIDKEGKIWMGSFTDGISIYNPKNNQFNRINRNTNPKMSIRQNGIGDILIFSDSLILAASQEGLIEIRNNKIKKIILPPEYNIPHSHSGTIAITSTGDLVVGTLDGVGIKHKNDSVFYSRKNPGTYKKIFDLETSKKGHDSHAVASVFVDSKDRIWISYWTPYLIMYDPKNDSITDIDFTRGNPDVYHGFPTSFIEDKRGNIWIGTSGKGLFQYHPKTNAFKQYINDQNRSNSLSSNYIQSLFLDRHNILWIGCNRTISLLNLNDPPFKEYFLYDGKQRLNTENVIDIKASGIWGTDGKSVYKINQNKQVVERITFPDWPDPVWNIHPSKSKRIYIAGDKSFHILDLQMKSFESFDHLPELKNNPVMHILEENDSIVWLSRWWYHEQGLLRLNINEKSLKVIQLPDYTEDERGYVVWGGAIINSSSARFLSNLGWFDVDLKSHRVTQFVKEVHGNGFVFFKNKFYANSSHEGIIISEFPSMKKSYLTKFNGLPSNQINGLFVFNDELWMTYKRGLIRIQTGNNRITYFDGFSTNGIENIANNANIIILSKNEPAFCEGGRLLVLNKQVAEQPQITDIVRISDLQINGKLHFPEFYSKEFSLNYNSSINELSFSTLSYGFNGEVMYRYKLEGLDEEWNLTKTPEVKYLNLPDGTFYFRVSYSTDGEHWSEDQVLLSIRVQLPFYREWWFIILIIASVTFIYFLVYTYREKKKTELQRLRNNISRDLHDEVGSTLSGINILSESLRMLLEKNPDEAVKISNQIGENASRMLGVMDDIVWAINPKDDSLLRMLSRLREQCYEMAENFGLILRFVIEPEIKDDIQLPIIARKNLYLMTKECVNNACKHSESNAIEVKVKVEKNTLIISIRDEGKGFDPVAPRSRNGIRILHDRAQEMKAVLNINSSPGKGTLTEISWSIPR